MCCVYRHQLGDTAVPFPVNTLFLCCLGIEMSEKEQFLPQPPSGAYHTQSRQVSMSTFSAFTARANRSCDKAENVLNRLLVRAVLLLQMREFMAEFLATFILVVSSIR